MTSSDSCEKSHSDYHYFNCEHVQPWHITLSVVLLILTVIVGILVLLNSILVHKYKYFNSIRFRCPISIIAWGILTEIYLISRILYTGILFKWWSFSIELDTATYTIRSLGLNGGIIIYIIRAWMYYVTYKYDQDLLNNRISTNKSWLFSNARYKNTIVNEKWLLKLGIVFLCVLTSILGVCRAFDYGFFSNIYYGISFLSSVSILILIFKFAHDQLGIRIEYAAYFIVYIFGFVGTVLITSVLEDTSRRVLSWFGGLVLLFAGNAFTFYFPFIRGKLFHIIRYGDTKHEKFENHKELALILSSKRTFDAFRVFLASIFCVENIDFFVVVAHYRRRLKEEQLKQQQVAETPQRTHHGHTASMVLNKVLNPFKILHATPDNEAVSALDEAKELKHGYMGLNTGSPISIDGDENALNDESDIGVITPMDMDRDESVVMDAEDIPTRATAKQHLAVTLELIETNNKIKKAVNSTRCKGILNELKKQKSAGDYINDLVTEKDGKKVIDIKNLTFGYLEYNDAFNALDINEWPQWIYDEYISNRSDHAINIDYGSRLMIQQQFEPNKYGTGMEEATEGKDTMKQKIFDNAQYEIWKLMANDSLNHFKRTPNYKQLRSFLEPYRQKSVP